MKSEAEDLTELEELDLHYDFGFRRMQDPLNPEEGAQEEGGEPDSYIDIIRRVFDSESDDDIDEEECSDDDIDDEEYSDFVSTLFQLCCNSVPTF